MESRSAADLEGPEPRALQIDRDQVLLAPAGTAEAAATTAAASAATTTAAAATTTAAATGAALVGLADAHRATAELTPVESLARLRGAVRILVLDERESARATGIAVHDHTDRSQLPMRLEELAELSLVGGEWKVPYVKLLTQLIYPVRDPFISVRGHVPRPLRAGHVPALKRGDYCCCTTHGGSGPDMRQDGPTSGSNHCLGINQSGASTDRRQSCRSLARDFADSDPDSSFSETFLSVLHPDDRAMAIRRRLATPAGFEPAFSA